MIGFGITGFSMFLPGVFLWLLSGITTMIESFQAWTSSPEAHELLPYLLLDAVFILLLVVSILIATREP
ncbi:hypothetical protein D5E85_27475 [Vibrio parahaemolyticus]|nr:hypothetical protein D5E85_27475 [Vibrio parahaemolyticus]